MRNRADGELSDWNVFAVFLVVLVACFGVLACPHKKKFLGAKIAEISGAPTIAPTKCAKHVLETRY